MPPPEVSDRNHPVGEVSPGLGTHGSDLLSPPSTQSLRVYFGIAAAPRRPGAGTAEESRGKVELRLGVRRTLRPPISKGAAVSMVTRAARYVTAAGGAGRRAGASGRSTGSPTGMASAAAISGALRRVWRRCPGARPDARSSREAYPPFRRESGAAPAPSCRALTRWMCGVPRVHGRGGSGGDGPRSRQRAGLRRASVREAFPAAPAHTPEPARRRAPARSPATVPPSVCAGGVGRLLGLASRSASVRTRKTGTRGP